MHRIGNYWNEQKVAKSLDMYSQVFLFSMDKYEETHYFLLQLVVAFSLL